MRPSAPRNFRPPPAAVSAEGAHRWLAPSTAEEAEHLARMAMLNTDLFEWFPVTRALNTGGDGPEMGVPVELAVQPMTKPSPSSRSRSTARRCRWSSTTPTKRRPAQ